VAARLSAKGAAYDHGLGFEVQVAPLQAKRLSLPESEGESDAPAAAVASLCDHLQDAARLLDGEWFHLDLLGLLDLDLLGLVDGEATRVHGGGQARPQDSMYGVDRADAGPRLLPVDEPPADDFGRERTQLHPCKMGQQVHLERGPVAVDGLGLARRQGRSSSSQWVAHQPRVVSLSEWMYSPRSRRCSHRRCA